MSTQRPMPNNLILPDSKRPVHLFQAPLGREFSAQLTPHEMGHQRRRARLRRGPQIVFPLEVDFPRPPVDPRLDGVERPLAIPDQKTPRRIVEARAVDHEVVVLVPLPRDLERHVREHRVALHPPQELHVGPGQQHRPDNPKLRAEPRQLGFHRRRAVRNLEAVKSAVIDLVLEGLEEVVLPERATAGLLRRRRARHEEDTWLLLLLPWVDEASGFWVPGEPFRPFFVPACDARDEGSGLGEEAVADLEEVLLGSAELAGADCAAEDHHGEDQAQDRDLAVPYGSPELTRPLGSETPLQHFFFFFWRIEGRLV